MSPNRQVVKRRFATIVTLFVMTVVPPSVQAVEIATSVRGPAPTSEKVIEGTVTFIPFGVVDRNGKDMQKVTTQLTVPGHATVDLPAGQWRVSIDVPGYFADAQVAAGGPAAPPVHFAVWPTGFIGVEFAFSKGAKPPPRVEVKFTASHPQVSDAPPASWSICDSAAKGWRCEVAAGEIDVRLRATGFMTCFRPGLKVTAGKTVDLGTVRLEPGSSVVGFVSSLEKIDLRSVRVALIPVTDHPSVREAAATTVAVQNEKGAFELRGVSPGMYKVRAVLKRLVSDEVTVLVRENSEVELRDPLILAPPRQLRVSITPPQGPDGKPWHVAVDRAMSVSNWETVNEGDADSEGLFAWSGLRDGLYGVNVQSSSNETFAVREIESTNDDMDVSIAVQETRVEGSVMIGSSPLAARVVVGGARGLVSVALSSGSDGQFAGTVPFSADEAWEVTVESKTQHLQRTLKVTPTPRSEDEPVRLDIVLPARSISGVVVDGDGKALDRATVSVEPPGVGEDPVQLMVEKNGTFVVGGLAAGTYRLQAWSFDHRDSDVISVALPDSGETEPVRLVVKEKNEAVGRVVSRAGPIEGATVMLFPTDAAVMMIAPETTGPDGEFKVSVPRGSREGNLTIEASGFAFKMLHLVLGGRPTTLVLDQAGGTITADVPEISEDLTVLQGFLLHRGADLSMMFFASGRGSPIEPSNRKGHSRITILTMEPGDYALCRLSWAEIGLVRSGALPPGRCTSGTLSALGELTLVAP